VQHCEQDTLALLALGEAAASAEDDRHLSGCEHCQSELAALRAVVTASRQITPADRPVSPPPAVWDRITTELGIQTPQLPHSPTGPTTAQPVVSVAERRANSWTRRTAVLTAAAAVAGVLAGVVGVGIVQSRKTTESVVTATTELKPLSVAEASGSASLHSSPSGETLTVQISGLRQVSSGFYEVWLADKQTKKMISVGVLDPANQGSFDVPSGLDLTEFRVVDVSLETFDGNPLHSAISVVRGTFPA